MEALRRQHYFWGAMLLSNVSVSAHALIPNTGPQRFMDSSLAFPLFIPGPCLFADVNDGLISCLEWIPIKQNVVVLLHSFEFCRDAQSGVKDKIICRSQRGRWKIWTGQSTAVRTSLYPLHAGTHGPHAPGHGPRRNKLARMRVDTRMTRTRGTGPSELGSEPVRLGRRRLR